jgi:predicted GNAT family acetyltransferase
LLRRLEESTTLGCVLVRDNPALSRYEAVEDDRVVGFIDYTHRDGEYWFVHTEIDEALKGSGAGAFLVRRSLDDVRAKGALVIPACPFVAGWIRRHPEYQDLVDQKSWHEFKRSRRAGRRRTVRTAPFDPSTPLENRPCPHVGDDLSVQPDPWPAEGCAECLAMGERNWLHLRICRICGHVGCCDSSPGKHGTAHARVTGHPLIRSYEPGDTWWYCYVDTVTFEVDGAPASPSHPVVPAHG